MPLPHQRLTLAPPWPDGSATCRPGLRARLERLDRSTGGRPWILALGKAALTMAEAAVRTLADSRREPTGGLIVAPAASASPHPALPGIAGDHPEPGPGSRAAAAALGARRAG